ncbi:MAG: energy-coupling factor ABC transporter ATP-binding protein, partial [Thermomicrobium sp.]|nr:energy-coupling factor ABC transporter ATP-binding protein [Thermomicrobium sp.]
ASCLTPARPARRARNAVAYVPQFPGALLLSSRLADDVELARRASGCTRDDVRRVVELFDLAPRLDAHPFDLSSGERQRAALAVALVGTPDLIVLDEPTRGLSLTLKHRLARELRARAAEGAAVLVTTHDVDFAGEVADRVLLLADGRIVADGPPERVLGSSLAYAPLVSRILGPEFLTLDDVDAQTAVAPACDDATMGYTGSVDWRDRTNA